MDLELPSGVMTLRSARPPAMLVRALAVPGDPVSFSQGVPVLALYWRFTCRTQYCSERAEA